ncbi:Peptidase M20,ArgE/DapE/ACY1/CPG2/YscS, conserved site,Peptidase M20, dimerisation domain,N-acyl-L- [Cinara cedri]|uniref:N-acyl-aliphatic-L-amino acid amidohydrolase n=1 Tax=Cinara cedri TaxID=506608 RepID=A0A5E4NA39_9HEMI|nr:Peptidase M20,ArgE/DapE/ACY1/CPG2/YscS, conserved site,Peptidase M20, dimerisation domain,N-acyl-L- [Cinara cedri]
MSSTRTLEHESVTIFRKYLRIPSVQPNVNYSECIRFLEEQSQRLGLPLNIYYITPEKPIVIITWVGQQPELPSLLLTSHMDVVPVYPECWTYNPFSAYKDENGNIFARGAQDMKCVGIQYLETIRKYITEQLKFNRTIHICFTPDEEIGSQFGMAKFVKTSEFSALNVGFALDEGKATPNEVFNVFYCERTVWDLVITCVGPTGHGSLLHENTAGEKIQYIINKFMNWREVEKNRLRNSNLGPGDVTTVNLTKIKGGCQINVVPNELSVGFDIRLAINVDIKQIERTVLEWCDNAGPGVTVQFKENPICVKPTKVDNSNPWWVAFKTECDKMNMKLNTCVATGGTDARFIRNEGIPALGFSPMNNTITLAHDHNEFINEKTFIKGLDIYYNIIKGLAQI